MPTSGGDRKGIKIYRRGTHRTSAPDDTIARVRPLMDAFGITRIANLTGLDRVGIPVVMVCRPNARSSAVFHGKGLELAAAKASGLMEAIETWHAENVDLPVRYGSFAELRKSYALADVGALPRAPSGRFHDDLPMLWVEGHDLIGGEDTWLPYEMVHANSTQPDPPGSGSFGASTNGLASGNHRLEAISHALCEVIERDATSLWHASCRELQDRRRLDLGSVDDAACKSVIDAITGAELDVAAWETTTDVRVPAFQCMIVDRTGEIGHVGHGAGCHPTREVALLRALTEAVQVRTTYIVGSREDIEHADYRAATIEMRNRRAHTLMRSAEPTHSFMSVGRFEFDDFEAEIAWLASRLEIAGIRQAIFVDLTQAAHGISVVRVVVPGLEGSDHHAGYVPGRRAHAMEARRT
ncbi:MAG TPA: YcaO-like family protein [Alphaproteobacteria bacterium]|nr:YcaO-like family protein [Alphaproteobacteria bacterium]